MKAAAQAWERTRRRPHLSRLKRAGALGLALLVSALWPHPARAACGWTDPTACGVDIQYRLYYYLASLGWFVDRSLLQLAYQLDQMRAWTIEVAFTTLYQMVVEVVSPAYIPVATVALMLACLLLMLAPVTGRSNFLNFRHVLVWLILAPVLLTIGGQMLSQAEQVRMSVSTTFFTAATGGLPGAVFGPAGSDMPAPQPLYPSNSCGVTLAYAGGTQLHLDALAAALDYADAGDIWCPDARGPSRDIPDGFYITPPGFAFDGNPGDLNTQAEQLAAVDGMQRGAIRTWVSIPACALAAGESLLNLLLALALALLWLGLPLGLLFVYFQQTSQAVTLIFARAISVLLVSWSSGIALGLLFSCLLAAARLGNAAAYAGLAIGGLVLVGYLLIVAGMTLLESLKTLSVNVQNATGLSVTQPLELAAGAAMMATGAGAVGAMGLAASGSTAYGAAAALGRVPGMASLGEVLAGMGELDTEGDGYRGLRAGGVSRMSWGAARRQMAWDAGGHGSIADEQGVVRPLERPAAPHIDRGRVGSVDIQADRLREIDLRRGAMQMHADGRIEQGRRLDASELAQVGATNVPVGQFNVARLLLDGYSVQQNDDDTLSFWKRDPRQQAVAAIQAAQPAREPTPFRRQLALRTRAAAQRDLYRMDAASAQARAAQLRAAGNTDEAEQWDERQATLERKAEWANAIAERGEAGIARRPSPWTTEEQATRRQVFQTALVEAEGQAQIDRGQIKERMSAAEARLAAIPQEIATIRSNAEQAALTAPPERAQAIQTEAEQQIAARMTEQRMLKAQQERDAQALDALTPTPRQRIAPAVRRIAADRARQRLAGQGLTQEARARQLRPTSIAAEQEEA